MAGLSDIRGGNRPRAGGLTPQLPRRTEIGDQPHHLAYITREEAEALRKRGGGVGAGGRQILGPGQVPAYYDAGDGSASGGDSNDGGDGDSGASDSGDGSDGATDGSPAADGTGVAGGGAPSGTDGTATDGSPAGDGTGAYGGGAPTGSTGPAAGRGGLAGLADMHDQAMSGKRGATAQAGVVGATVAGGLAGAAVAGMHGLAEGIGGLTGRATEALGGTPSTDGTVGDGPSGAGGSTASTDTAAAGIASGGTGGSGGTSVKSTAEIPAGWNEAAFLAANPEVATAVGDGTWESGYAFNRAWKKFSGQDYGTAPAGPQARNAYAYQRDFLTTPQGGVMPNRGYFPDHRGPYG